MWSVCGHFLSLCLLNILLYSVFLSVLFFLLDVFIETFLISFESLSYIISFCFLASLIVCLHSLMANLYLFLSISPLFHFLHYFVLLFKKFYFVFQLLEKPTFTHRYFLIISVFLTYIGLAGDFPCWGHLKIHFFSPFPCP